MNWQELIISIKRKSKFSYERLAAETGVSCATIADCAKGTRGDVKFSIGIILIEYAKEIGADISRAKL